MSFTSLYRKYRPKIFEDIIGQDSIIKTLSNQIKTDEISHAYLFSGTRGTGKTSVAKIFANSVNCLSPVNGSPCYNCSYCNTIENESNLDILEIDAASNNRVDEVRDLREKIKYQPTKSKYKVYIIDEVHMLTDSAFNALLKTLEEPPKHAIFILATTEAHKLPATILSRVLRFDFKIIGTIEIADHIKKIYKKENVKYEDDAVLEIARKGNGSVRDALSIADLVQGYSSKNVNQLAVIESLGITSNQTIFNISLAIIEKDIESVISVIDNVNNEGKNFSVLLKNMIEFFKNLIIINKVDNAKRLLGLSDEIYKENKQMSIKISPEELLYFMKIFSEKESEMRYSSDQKTVFELACLSCILDDYNKIHELENRIKRLEKGKNVKLKDVSKQNKLNTENKKNTNNVTTPINTSDKFNYTSIWGEVLVYLRKNKYPLLYSILSDADITGEDNILIITTKTKMTYDSLVLKENLEKLKEILKNISPGIEINIRLEENKDQSSKEKIKFIEKKVGKKINVI